MLSTFPHLTESEYEDACHCFLRQFQQRGHEQTGWLSVETVHQNDIAYLRVTKELSAREDCLMGGCSELEDDEVQEDDGEVLRATITPRATIHYDMILSPVYRVPVLYISISDPLHRYPPTMSTLYEHLVPPEFKAQTENVGIIGGITITDHPATNRPVFFIHPCQTAEVMEASAGKSNVTTKEYLMVWIGALGKCVGLNVPLVLAR
ncbi:hypothetical protein EJ02DRAFT_313312, partial [Clathrospora elynae]